MAVEKGGQLEQEVSSLCSEEPGRLEIEIDYDELLENTTYEFFESGDGRPDLKLPGVDWGEVEGVEKEEAYQWARRQGYNPHNFYFGPKRADNAAEFLEDYSTENVCYSVSRTNQNTFNH